MKTILSIFLVTILTILQSTTIHGFGVVSPIITHSTHSTQSLPSSTTTTTANTATSSTSLNMVFGNRKTKAQKEEEAAKAAMYWEGEWVCKDCGYIYQRAECAGMFFEEQSPGFRCPQCSGPRRRYAKKVGDVVGTTLDGGDAPILIFSFGGVIATIAFGIWAVDNL